MRVFPIVVACLFLSSGITVVGIKNQTPSRTQTLSLSFQEPSLIDDGGFTKVLMQGADGCVYHPGQPVLPLSTTTLELPFGSIIRGVSIDTTEIHSLSLPNKIVSAPYPVIDGATPVASSTVDETVYQSAEYYPDQWVTYTTGAGLNTHSEHVTFLTIQVTPVRYSPMTDTIQYQTQCQVTITYDPPVKSIFPEKSLYDLVIITPSQFILPVSKLADHKNSVGINTMITTLEEIYSTYKGNDRPEQIKFFIKHAVEAWGVKYILLVGGMKSHLNGAPRDDLNEGSKEWYLPVRYTNLWDVDAAPPDPGFISDLYYADIYNGSGDFCSWDSCGDGVYGGWTNPTIGPPNYQTDQIDFYPDVYLGRLPCRNIYEVTNIVNKIIAYEEKPLDSSWFKKIVVVGGDPYDDQGTNYNEGELVAEKAVSYLPGFTPVRLYASYQQGLPRSTPLARNIIREISAGCGLLFFDGHGSPGWWNAYWPGQFDSLIQGGGLSVYQFPWLQNGNRLPVCVIGGCHNSMFNVTLVRTLTDSENGHATWTYGLPIPECWSWSLTVKRSGGAIATIGSTGLGYEAGGEVGDLNGDNCNEPDCVEALGGYLESQFFRAYGVDHVDILGNAWCAAINAYLNIYPGMQNRSDAKTVEQWILFGDPSLKIGGYGP